MAVDRLSITVPAQLGQAVREAAQASGTSVSSWVSAAIEEHVRQLNLGGFLDEWQAEHGALTDDDVDRARRALAGEVDEQLAAS